MEHGVNFMDSIEIRLVAVEIHTFSLPIWRFSVKVGNLVKMKSGGTVWLMLDIVADTILVLNQRTKYKMWATKSAFEVIA
jgi:hypothetical protein